VAGARPAPLVLRALRSTAVSIVEKRGNLFNKTYEQEEAEEAEETEETEHSIRAGTLIGTNPD
jgi:hypothetical protein